MTARLDSIPAFVVDVHVHAIPTAVTRTAVKGSLTGISARITEAGTVFEFPGMAPSPPAPAALTHLAEMEEWSAGHGVDLQLIGPWTDLLGYTLERPAARKWTRIYNEALVDECRTRPGMSVLGTVPLSHPDLVADELTFAKQIGCRGVMIGTAIPGLDLGSPELDRFWAAAADLSMPILIHPTFLEIAPPLRRAGLKNAVGRSAQTGLAVTQLVYSGALTRHSGLTVIVAHGGGGFFPMARRVVRNWELGWSSAEDDPRLSIERLYVDSVVLDPGYLSYLAGIVTPGRILLGSDHPFPWEPDPVETVLAAGLSPLDTRAILGETAAVLYGLEGPARTAG